MITYDPKKGTLHKNVDFYKPNYNKQQEEVQNREYDLRYGYPTRLASDVIGAIFQS
jgi:hypothetical protein